VESFIGHLLLFAGMIFGLVSIPFGLPGTIVILLCILIYALVTHFHAAVGLPFFLVLSLMTLLAETADHWLGAIGARRFGASTASIWLSFLGGLAGAIVIGGPLAVAFGPFGPIVGGFAGAFSIVVVYELYRGKSPREAFRAGLGTFLGRMAGMALKVVISVTMIIAVAVALFL
jgi:uncharacterized protein YqgC (DUF456 family)